MIEKIGDDRCFQYVPTIELNHEKIESHPERVSIIEPFINNYIWEAINILYIQERRFVLLIF